MPFADSADAAAIIIDITPAMICHMPYFRCCCLHYFHYHYAFVFDVIGFRYADAIIYSRPLIDFHAIILRQRARRGVDAIASEAAECRRHAIFDGYADAIALSAD
jgi:hypothetical protein